MHGFSWIIASLICILKISKIGLLATIFPSKSSIIDGIGIDNNKIGKTKKKWKQNSIKID